MEKEYNIGHGELARYVAGKPAPDMAGERQPDNEKHSIRTELREDLQALLDKQLDRLEQDRDEAVEAIEERTPDSSRAFHARVAESQRRWDERVANTNDAFTASQERIDHDWHRRLGEIGAEASGQAREPRRTPPTKIDCPFPRHRSLAEIAADADLTRGFETLIGEVDRARNASFREAFEGFTTLFERRNRDSDGAFEMPGASDKHADQSALRPTLPQERKQKAP